MKTIFGFVIALLASAPSFGAVQAADLGAGNSTSAELTLTVARRPCGQQVIQAAQTDFAFYSNGTRSDGSPAIECGALHLLQKTPATDGGFNLDYQLRCYTLDRAVQRNYLVSTIQTAAGECQQQRLSSEDDSP